MDVKYYSPNTDEMKTLDQEKFDELSGELKVRSCFYRIVEKLVTINSFDKLVQILRFINSLSETGPSTGQIKAVDKRAA